MIEMDNYENFNEVMMYSLLRAFIMSGIKFPEEI